MNDNHFDSFRNTLEECHEWPCSFTFKFIAPKEVSEELSALFPIEAVRLRPSRAGKYISVTAEMTVCNSEEVVSIYRQAMLVPGVICL